MHLTRISIENIRSIRSLEWSVRAERATGWHVILGENGSGKTALLQIATLTLLGETKAQLLRPTLDGFLRWDEDHGRIEIELFRHEAFDPPMKVMPSELSSTLELTRQVLKGRELFGDHWPGFELNREEVPKGWFNAGYGPYRRFTGGDPDASKLLQEDEYIARNATLFEKRVSLYNTIMWFKDLHHRKLEEKVHLGTNGSSLHEGPTGIFLERLIALINQPGLLPHGTKLHDVSSKGIRFVDGNGAMVQLEELSDGFGSILSLTIDLIRRITEAFDEDKVFAEDGMTIAPPGVVFIDEIDAHLHPTWQHEVGNWFKRYFPNIQFIVTTHSPIVCQAADSVFVLPKPGSEEDGYMLEGIELDRLRYGDVLEAYGTGVFGEGVTRSEKSREMLHRLVELNRKEVDIGLSDAERKEQRRLRAILPTTAPLLRDTTGESAA